MIIHIQGANNIIADTLSRLYSETPGNLQVLQHIKEKMYLVHLSPPVLSSERIYIIVGASRASTPLISSACQRMKHAYRPSTTSAHRTHVRAYFAFLQIMKLPPTLHNIMVFIEYLHQNFISYKVISSYVSSIESMSLLYNLPSENFSHPAITRLLRSISLSSHFAPTSRGIFDIRTLYTISIACDSTDDPHLYRAIFLVAFHGFLRMSNIAPNSSKNFSKQHHFLRQDVIFGPQGPI